jgi:hypothetical protein
MKIFPIESIFVSLVSIRSPLPDQFIHIGKPWQVTGISHVQSYQEKPAMNKDMFDSKWKEIRSQSNGWWSLMTDDELDKVAKSAVKYDKYVTLLQVKYGYTRDQARKEIARRMTEFENRQKIIA